MSIRGMDVDCRSHNRKDFGPSHTHPHLLLVVSTTSTKKVGMAVGTRLAKEDLVRGGLRHCFAAGGYVWSIDISMLVGSLGNLRS